MRAHEPRPDRLAARLASAVPIARNASPRMAPKTGRAGVTWARPHVGRADHGEGHNLPL